MSRISEAFSEEFDGETFVKKRDGARLKGQLAAVYSVMTDYQWHTLREVAERCGGSEAGVSARIRDLRKEKFGKMSIDRRCLENGLWEYKLKQL